MSADRQVDVAVIGAGIAGVAVGYYLSARHGVSSVLLIDSRQPLSFTSARSGDNYRNWWPHPVMVEFTDRSIELMDEVAVHADIGLSRGGYVLATRRTDIDDLLEGLQAGYGGDDQIRIHATDTATDYPGPGGDDECAAPTGVDVLAHPGLIRRTFPAFTDAIARVLHVRRAGSFDSQTMGLHMLGHIRAAGGAILRARVRGIETGPGFVLETRDTTGNVVRVGANRIVNAGGPFAGEVAAMLGADLPVVNVFQQKILCADVARAIPRSAPFSIDLDAQPLDWSDDDRRLLAGDPDSAWLAGTLPGGVHCRPDGGRRSQRLKLGWAYNRETSVVRDDPVNDPHFDAAFPDLVLRRAAALYPALKPYLATPPPGLAHYGGYYTMTAENWPLIGPMGVDGAFVVAALSGFGSMAACAAGELCAAWVAGAGLPGYAAPLSPARYRDAALMTALRAAGSKGIL